MNDKAFSRARCALVLFFALSGLARCGGSSSMEQTPPPPPLPPSINTISPTTALAGGAAFTLTINGANFVAGSVVNFGGAAPTTTFVSSTQLTAAIPAAAIASTGMPAVTVSNPAPGVRTSNPVNFTITSGLNSVPTISGIFPNCVPAGEQFVGAVNNQLQVVGNNFVAGSVVRWNGSDRPTSSDAINGLVAQISASDIAAAGTAAVSVFNPAPGGGTSNSLTFTTTSGTVDPQSIALDSAGKFAYVANAGCNDSVNYVSMYTINPTTGALTSIGPPETSDDDGSDFVTVDPLGKFAYVTNWGDWETSDGSVLAYTINPTTGALTLTGAIVGDNPSFCCFNSVVVDPSGKFAYVANGGGGSTTLSMYTINATTGALTSIGTIATGGDPVSVAVDPSGKFVYAANEAFSGSAGSVSMYTIDATTGALASNGTIAAGTDPASVVVDPSGKFAYVANSSSNDVSMYTINATTGALAFTGMIAAGADPVTVAVDPSGRFAYVVNLSSNNVSMYTINATTGALTPTGTIAAGLSPTSITVHPSGKFAYVTNSATNDVSIYSIDAATGALTLIGTIGT
jgi:6-phosphogluconolactonase